MSRDLCHRDCQKRASPECLLLIRGRFTMVDDRFGSFQLIASKKGQAYANVCGCEIASKLGPGNRRKLDAREQIRLIIHQGNLDSSMKSAESARILQIGRSIKIGINYAQLE